jgi:23S rRNA (pseudouridine1915-N3)-methyltransferase
MMSDLMRIDLICVGQRMPRWVSEGYTEYARRLPREWHLQLHEIAPGQRARGQDARRAMQQEGQRMLRAMGDGGVVVTLDVRGSAWSTEQLAERLREWMDQGAHLKLLVGGADGLAPACRERASASWSLSKLTLPHPLVRIVLAEQLYRAWSIFQGHPYHRA